MEFSISHYFIQINIHMIRKANVFITKGKGNKAENKIFQIKIAKIFTSPREINTRSFKLAKKL